MKKVLIILPGMSIGGAERSALGLLKSFDYSKVDVSLFLYRHEGELLKYIPKEVHLLPEVKEYTAFVTPIISVFQRKMFRLGAARLYSKIALKVHSIITRETSAAWMPLQYTSHYLQHLLPAIEGSYDVGIMFLGIADTLANKVDAKLKLAWCHTDYDTIHPDKKMDLDTYEKMDYVVNVSEACTEKFVAFYPQLRDKALTIENCLSKKQVLEEAVMLHEGMKDNDEIKLLSIGRFCSIKNFHNIPFYCRYLRERGLNVHWYIIGYGPDEEKINQAIENINMGKYVTVLGKKDNPYPYINCCDVYVQPSVLEGKCVTVREAQMLGKPVVITNYATSASQLENGVDGVVVPMDNEGCADGIAALLRDPEKMAQLSAACRERDYSNAGEVEKIYKMMED